MKNLVIVKRRKQLKNLLQVQEFGNRDLYIEIVNIYKNVIVRSLTRQKVKYQLEEASICGKKIWKIGEQTTYECEGLS